MSDFLQRLRREQGDEISPLERMSKQVGKELEAFAINQGAWIAEVITKAAKSARVPRDAQAYLFWLLVEQSGQWPTLDPAKKTALSQAVFLMEQSNAAPNYTANFNLPDEDVEEQIENVIEAAATWAKGPFRAKLLRQYLTILDKKKAAAARLLGSTPDVGRGRLEGSFLTAVKRHPRWFGHPNLLFWALKPIMR